MSLSLAQTALQKTITQISRPLTASKNAPASAVALGSRGGYRFVSTHPQLERKIRSTPTSASNTSTMSSALAPYLSANSTWATSVKEKNTTFFEESAKGQKPGLLWFGCSDSRVPESVILQQQPGSVFVHRNVANQFLSEDDSANAVLTFAVGALGVRQIVVVGHTDCGGCAAAHQSPKPSGPAATMDDLIVANVKKGVDAIASSSFMQKHWEEAKEKGETPAEVHGLVYDLGSGLLKEIGYTKKASA